MDEAKNRLENYDGFWMHGYIGLTDLGKTSGKEKSTVASPHRLLPVDVDSVNPSETTSRIDKVGETKVHESRPEQPKSSSWATLYRVCGGIILVVGLSGTIAVAQKNEEAGFQLAVMVIALTLTSFLFAFLIDVLTDMRHYLMRIAEKQ